MRSKLFLVTNCIASAFALASLVLCILGGFTTLDIWLALTMCLALIPAWVSFGIQQSLGAVIAAFSLVYNWILSMLIQIFNEAFFTTISNKFTVSNLIVAISGSVILLVLFIISYLYQNAANESENPRSKMLLVTNILAPLLAIASVFPTFLADEAWGMITIFLILFIIPLCGWLAYFRKKAEWIWLSLGMLWQHTVFMNFLLVAYAISNEVLSVEIVPFVLMIVVGPVILSVLYIISYFRQKILSDE